MKIVSFADRSTARDTQRDELWTEGLAKIDKERAKQADDEWLQEHRAKLSDQVELRNRHAA